MSRSPELTRRLAELAAADPPALFVVDDSASPADLDEALRIISALPKKE